jgi:hypothetical protein
MPECTITSQSNLRQQFDLQHQWRNRSVLKMSRTWPSGGTVTLSGRYGSHLNSNGSGAATSNLAMFVGVGDNRTVSECYSGSRKISEGQ